MQKPKNKTQFNIREYLDSSEYVVLRSQISSEINSCTVSIDRTRSNTKEEIKAVKKAYNKLKKDPEAFKITRDEIISQIAESAKKEYKSNFVLIVN